MSDRSDWHCACLGRAIRLALSGVLLITLALTLSGNASATNATTTLLPTAICNYDRATPSGRRTLVTDPCMSLSIGAAIATNGLRRFERDGFAGFIAAKAGDEAFHYTRSELAALIEKEGLRPGSYLTKSGKLSTLQAQLDLALPPNRGLADAVIRVDLAGLRKAGYKVGEFTTVGRKYNMPGGGTELRFSRAIPPRFLTVVRR